VEVIKVELMAGPFTCELCDDFVCVYYTEDGVDEGCFDIQVEDIPDFCAALLTFAEETPRTLAIEPLEDRVAPNYAWGE
jgi:hypothetical protein